MKWIVLLLVCVCGLLAIHQVSLNHRIQQLQQERDNVRTELQSQNDRLEQVHASMQQNSSMTGLAGEDGSSISANTSGALAGNSSTTTSVREADRVRALERQVRDLTAAAATGNVRPRSAFPEYDPTAPNASRIQEPTSQEVATNANANTGRSWGPEQVTGPPDTDQSGDIPTAWATLLPDNPATEWLWVGFDRPTSLAEVRIRETYNPGAISKVTARNGNQEILLWEGTSAAGRAPRDFVIPVRENVSAQSIVVYLESGRVAGWNEIDAVELVGRDGSRQWANSAAASSTFAERTPTPPASVQR